MPDIATALRTALTKWDDEPSTTNKPNEPAPAAKKPHFSVTNNVCRATFDCILKNPGKTRKEITDALLEGGYKPSSTATLIGQMVKQYHVRETRGLLYATSNEYTPLKNAKAWAKLQANAQRKKVIVVKRRKPEDVEPVYSDIVTAGGFDPRNKFDVPPTWTVDSVIDKLSVKQAMAVYDELRKIFGSNT